MTAYPYSGRDLFAEPESYFYAECTSKGYLDIWKQSRIDFCRNLAGACATPMETECPPDSILLVDLLAKAGLQDVDAAALIINPLVIKYEVHKRLFAAYLSIGKRHPHSLPAPLGVYVTFGEALLRQAETGSLRHLSTMLKLDDALASQPAVLYSAEEAGRLVKMLNVERRLVEKLEGLF